MRTGPGGLRMDLLEAIPGLGPNICCCAVVWARILRTWLTGVGELVGCGMWTAMRGGGPTTGGEEC